VLIEVLLRQRSLREAWTRYAAGLAFFRLALAARDASVQVEGCLPFATQLQAMILTIHVCGVVLGAVVAALSALSGLYIFSSPHFSWEADVASQLAAIALLFASTSTGGVLRRLQMKSNELHVALQRLSSSELAIGDALTITGFPLGFHDASHPPILAHIASIALAYGARLQRPSCFLTDARTHRGSGGSPVVRQRTHDTESTSSRNRQLLGVQSTHMDMVLRDQTQDESLGLNCA
jgi:uncharacterized membrane protein